jgi:hypothetical protein
MEEYSAFIFKFKVLWVQILTCHTGIHHLSFLVKLHVTLNFNDPKLLTSMLTSPPRNNFLSSLFKYSYSKRNLKWGFQRVTNTLPRKWIIKNAEGEEDLQHDWANRNSLQGM